MLARHARPHLPLVIALAVASLLMTALVGAAGATTSTTPSLAPPDWADVGQATVTPGVQTFTEGAGQCTANFVFYEARADGQGFEVYLGQAAHCAGTGGATATNGCDAGSLPLGTPVQIQGATHPGTLAYSSWLTMQAVGETDGFTCQFNDFALVRVHPDDHGLINPSLPVIGGPTGLNTAGTAFGEDVHSYGNSGLRLGLAPLSPKRGVSLGTNAGGWNHPVYTVSPGIPGDSGSAFLDSEGAALGSLSTLQFLPLAGSNGVSDLSQALAYANAHTDHDFILAEGTAPFTPFPSGLGGLGGVLSLGG